MSTDGREGLLVVAIVATIRAMIRREWERESMREDLRDTDRNCHVDIKLCRSTEVLTAQLLKR